MKNLTWQNPEQLFVAQELINKVKSKCCGIKVYEKKKYSRSVETVDYVKSVSLADSMMFVKDVLVSSGINVKEALLKEVVISKDGNPLFSIDEHNYIFPKCLN